MALLLWQPRSISFRVRYILNGTNIKSPTTMTESNSTLYAIHKSLSGSVGRDYFGSNKRVWQLNYETVNTNDYTAINNIYRAYLVSQSPVSWRINQTNYSVSSTLVHIELLARKFTMRGSSYISSFTLTLIEA